MKFMTRIGKVIFKRKDNVCIHVFEFFSHESRHNCYFILIILDVKPVGLINVILIHK